MVLRVIAAIVTASFQWALLWLAIFLAVRLAVSLDSKWYHHQGVSFGLLMYYLLMFNTTSFFIVNLTSAIINQKWFTWVMICCAIIAAFFVFGGDPEEIPWRMLFLAGAVTPLFLATVLLNRLVSRALQRSAKRFPKVGIYKT